MKIYVDTVSSDTKPILRRLVFTDLKHRKYIVENLITHKGVDVPFDGKILNSQKYVGIFNIHNEKGIKFTEEEFINLLKSDTILLTKAVYDSKETRIKAMSIESNGQTYRPTILNKIIYKKEV